MVERISEPDLSRIIDPHTSDPDCRSAQTILSHVVSAGYTYSIYIRQALRLNADRPAKRPLSKSEILEGLQAMLAHTAQALEGHWEMEYDEIKSFAIKADWGPTFDLEQLLEHAIVHVLRHRRQIEKLGLGEGAPEA